MTIVAAQLDTTTDAGFADTLRRYDRTTAEISKRIAVARCISHLGQLPPTATVLDAMLSLGRATEEIVR